MESSKARVSAGQERPNRDRGTDSAGEADRGMQRPAGWRRQTEQERVEASRVQVGTSNVENQAWKERPVRWMGQ